MNHGSPPPDTIVDVPDQVLKDMFNGADYNAQLDAGQLRKVLVRERHLQMQTSQAKAMPFCTLSQIYRYMDSGDVWHAEVHQYLMPDGQVGASGLPDPKRLRRDGVVYILQGK